MSKLKTLVGLAVAVGALAAFAAPAMAWTNFEGNGTEITFRGGTQNFAFNGEGVVCNTLHGTAASFTGTKTELATKTVAFEGCEATGIGKATVTCSGFTFHIGGTVDFTGAGCEIVTATCKIKMAAQAGLESDLWQAVGSFEVEHKDNLNAIAYSPSGFCPGIVAGSHGAYIGNFYAKNLTVK